MINYIFLYRLSRYYIFLCVDGIFYYLILFTSIKVIIYFNINTAKGFNVKKYKAIFFFIIIHGKT